MGIDAPFGWSAAFTGALDAWDATRRWPAVTHRQLRYRVTDLHVQQQTGIWPLSPSADRIGVCAWRCAGLLTGWGVADLIGGDRVIEAYPAAALRCWELPSRGYKAQAPQARARTESVRAGIIAALRAACPWLMLTDAQWNACRASHDRLDALICALVARATATGAVRAPAHEQADIARREGWIQLPTCGSLASLADDGFQRDAR